MYIFSLRATSPNSGHTATLSSTQILPYGWTSHVRKTLSKIRGEVDKTHRGDNYV